MCFPHIRSRSSALLTLPSHPVRSGSPLPGSVWNPCRNSIPGIPLPPTPLPDLLPPSGYARPAPGYGPVLPPTHTQAGIILLRCTNGWTARHFALRPSAHSPAPISDIQSHPQKCSCTDYSVPRPGHHCSRCGRYLRFLQIQARSYGLSTLPAHSIFSNMYILRRDRILSDGHFSYPDPFPDRSWRHAADPLFRFFLPCR